MRGLSKKEIVEFIREKCKKLEITAYQINKATDILALAVQNILDGKTKKPRQETLATILNYIERQVLGTEVSEVPADYNKLRVMNPTNYVSIAKL